MTDRDAPRCFDCHWWTSGFATLEPYDYHDGDCRRHAPVVSPQPCRSPETLWPKTSATAMCGDFVRKEIASDD